MAETRGDFNIWGSFMKSPFSLPPVGINQRQQLFAGK